MHFQQLILFERGLPSFEFSLLSGDFNTEERTSSIFIGRDRLRGTITITITINGVLMAEWLRRRPLGKKVVGSTPESTIRVCK